MAKPDNAYGQYCPMVRAVEVLGERWTLLILRDMLVGVNRFNDLARGLPGLSRTLLTKRLRQLERTGIVTRSEGQYLLTDAGRDLEPLVFGIGEWGARWMFDEPRPDELDAELLVWWMHSRINTPVLPSDRTVIHIRFSDDPRLFWLLVESRKASVCLVDPGFEVDVTVRTDVPTLYEVWLGRRPLLSAVRGGDVALEGNRDLVRLMPEVLQLSPMAELVSTTRGVPPS
ncbi:MAG: helix-turn-helix domain-containing protein [Actinomycetota bacterium]